MVHSPVYYIGIIHAQRSGLTPHTAHAVEFKLAAWPSNSPPISARGLREKSLRQVGA